MVSHQPAPLKCGVLELQRLKDLQHNVITEQMEGIDSALATRGHVTPDRHHLRLFCHSPEKGLAPRMLED